MKIALVTGANKGIGREIATQFAELGMTVLLAARDRERGEEAAAKLANTHLDVTEPATIARAAAEIDKQYGRLDILVNNAGITGGWVQEPGSTDVDVIRKVFDTNVFGVIAVTDAMLPLLRRAPAARIVNMSSSVGSFAGMADPDGPLAHMPASAAYVPSKTALNAVTAQYAKHLAGTGILVNAACPGYCATDLNGHRGFRTPAQGAAIAVQLATVDGDGPTGGFFDDDGTVAW
jgi:NAD(P)-dependent dehydrogenase (short-subunit alcohol dehydrogenase family)